MADPICRWRNPTIETVRELITILPKRELEKNVAKQIIIEKNPFNADFFKTPYQLACQLGLYYILENRYFPKFTFMPSDEEIITYLQNWIIHYSVPNPYTRSLPNLEPFSIHSKFCSKLFEIQQELNYSNLLTEFLGDNIGNIDILKNALNFSPIIEIINNSVKLKEGKSYQDLQPYIDIDIISNRNDKEYFFDLFPVKTSNNIIEQILPEEVTLINQLQNLPNLSQTQKNQIVAARIGQGYFRRNLISECGFCPITQVNESTLLIASHIKPWKVSDNLERINPKNGFLFTPTYDKLFDKGFISFTNDKRILISDTLSLENRQKLNLVHNNEYPLLPTNGREGFLEFHRNNIFIQQ